MSNKPFEKLNALDQLVRRTARCGMTDGTVMRIEFISGFELFNTRPYHNYETWAQGWRVSGLGVCVEAEDLDDAVSQWAGHVDAKRKGWAIARHCELRGGTQQALLPDWIVANVETAGPEPKA